MILSPVAELRARLDVTEGDVSDAQLEHVLEVAAGLLGPWVEVPEWPNPHQALVDEATVQLAIKVWDTGTRGTAGLDMSGEWTMPAPAATPGLVRSVFGVLGPALSGGGLSV